MCLGVKGLWSSLGKRECPDKVTVASHRTGHLKRTRSLASPWPAEWTQKETVLSVHTHEKESHLYSHTREGIPPLPLKARDKIRGESECFLKITTKTLNCKKWSGSPFTHIRNEKLNARQTWGILFKSS